METINLLNDVKGNIKVAVVRYFTINGIDYLIFSLNEKDDQGYVKLYCTKIINENGNKFAKNIIDENEWSNVKKEIQVIVGINRSGEMYTKDLDYKQLENVQINETRVFKLQESIVNELAANKQKIIEPLNLNIPVTEPIVDAVIPSVQVEQPVVQSMINENQMLNDTMPNNLTDVTKSTEEVNDNKISDENLVLELENLKNENQRLLNELSDYKAKINSIYEIIK